MILVNQPYYVKVDLMTDRTIIWTQMQQTQTAIVQSFLPDLQKVLQSSIFNDVPAWGHLGLAQYIHPEPMTVKRIRQRNPYSATKKLEQDIQSLKEANFLDASAVITDTANQAYQGLIDAQDDVASKIDIVDDSILQEIIDAYDTIQSGIDAQAAPIFRDVITQELPENLLHRTYYLGYRFAAWRDDAHIKAWQYLNIDGHTYEAFSLVWDGTASTAEKFMDVRAGRGYDADEWQATLDKLVSKGWIVKEDKTYLMSAEGKQIRDNIEATTDDIFYAPFAQLSAEKIEHLLTLLKDVQGKFTPEPEAN